MTNSELPDEANIQILTALDGARVERTKGSLHLVRQGTLLVITPVAARDAFEDACTEWARSRIRDAVAAVQDPTP